MDPSESARRQSVILHVILAASLGAYAVILMILRVRATATPTPTTASPGLFPALALIGAAQFGFVSWAGRGLLRSRGSPGWNRARRYFLMRGTSAEAIGLYGMLAGFLRAPLGYTVALFVMSAAGLVASAPTRPAWDEAMRAAESSGP